MWPLDGDGRQLGLDLRRSKLNLWPLDGGGGGIGPDLRRGEVGGGRARGELALWTRDGEGRRFELEFGFAASPGRQRRQARCSHSYHSGGRALRPTRRGPC